jgi:hypothetical protein
MLMKMHILSALREEYDQWQSLLSTLSETQLSTPLKPSSWSVKDELAHLWAWQQRTTARCDSARLNRPPEFPVWPAGLDPNQEDQVDQINDWIYQSNRQRPWSHVHHDWSDGFMRFLDAAQAASEQNLIAGGLYPWLHGNSLAVYLLASYDHHQEHYEKLQSRLPPHS